MAKIGIIGAMEIEIEHLRSLMGENIRKTEAGSLLCARESEK